MNRPSLLHIIERLEGFLGKLPETIQRPIVQAGGVPVQQALHTVAEF